MRRRLTIALPTLLAFLVGLGYGRWYYHDRLAVAQAHTERPVLYYRCPMHPSFRSGRPGIAPCCNMKLQPVYADAQMPAGLAPGSIHVSSDKQQLIGVRLGKVEYRPLTQTIRAAARVTLNEEKVARVQTKLDGWVDQILVTKTGELVRKGQQLLTIYNSKSLPAQQDFLRALDGIPMSTNGAGPLVPPGTASAGKEAFIATARVRLELLGFSDAQIENIASTRQPMWKLPVYSPINGIVIERAALPRQRVTPEALYVIADLSSVWVVADLFDYRTASGVSGQAAILTVPYLPGERFRGVVDSVLPQLDATTRSVKIRVLLDNPDLKLKPEMYGDLQINTGAGRRALSVPREAVLDSGLKQRVFVDRGNGYLEPREVTVGQHFGDRIEIIKGLRAGQTIVISGNFLLDSESRLSHDLSDH
jgi:Cu(I)/Ag(I) efflux system membrane fusion protein